MTFDLSLKQKELLTKLKTYDLLFVTGAAGTGKTYISCLAALDALEKNQIDNIIISRPLVAVEDVGFLPGDLNEKVDPFLEPIFDVLYEIYDKKYIKRLVADKTIITTPLAFMRGKTLNNSFIILDEAQNTTKIQMSMFLTRFGDNIKCCVLGDLKQSDIGPTNGLSWALTKLKNASLINFVDFSTEDVVRSALVKEIMKHIYD